MKVTVCFGTIRVVVPCGNGDLTVAELMEKSVQRYRKAAGRTDDYWVRIRSLKSEGEEAILDTDDQVCDVADDREKLIASFDEQEGVRPPSHLITDGTSTCTSSVGTASPPLTFNSLDVNVNGQMNNSNNKLLVNHYGDFDDHNDVDVVVTGDKVSADPKLLVRCGSDPIMPVIVNGDPQKWNGTDNQPVDSNANSIPKPERKPSLEMIKKRRNSRDELSSAFTRFGRNSSRQSISNTLDNDVMYKWAEARQRVENKGSDGNDATVPVEREQIIIKNDGTPLGIQIIARVENDDDSAYGLVIHGIETGGRAARDGRLREGDHILTINKLDITEMSFDSAQELLRDAMRTDSVILMVEREGQPPTEATSPTQQQEIGDTPKVPPVVPARAPATSLSKEDSAQKVHNIIAPTNTRRIGRKLYVQLMKGPQGLGFSITTRDNAIGGKNPIYIKNILPKGAAIADGRCKPGDRLLEVNGIEMTGKSQSEAVSILRSVRLGGVVNLVLSRQDSNSPAAAPEQVLPREMPEEKNTDDPTNAKNKRVLVFDIPLNDTGSAGLGVSVKGKTSGNGTDGETKDLGIFIKSVIHGGAASKDGRLRPNDQLLYINEESLVNISNSGAMEILRRSMSGDKSPRSTIRLVVARRTEPGETASMLADKQADPSRAESVDGEVGPCPGSPVSISSRGMEIDMDAMDELFKHPVLNKLNALEKESFRQPVGPGVDGYVEDTGQASPTMPKGGAEVVMIEDADIDDAIAKIDAAGPSSAKTPSPPQWLVDTWEKAEQDNGELSPVDDPYNQFQRDSFARRSFSERHKGSLDAKEMAWYKRKYGTDPPKVPPKAIKNLKRTPQQKDIAISTGSLVKSNSTDNLTDNANLSSIHRLTLDERRDIGPSLGLKKNSSLESLQAAVAEVTTYDDQPTRPRAKVVRGRGCNESFRAAVDRSYDQPLSGTVVNSTSIDSVKEYKENGHGPLRDDRSSRDDHSSVSSHDPVIMSRTGSSKKTNKKEKEREKKKGSTFKGFGSMFRFGKNRKVEREGRPAEEEQVRSTSVSTEKSKEDIEKYKEQQEEQNSRIQDEVRKLREQQSLKRHKEESEEARNKAERMQELRQRYQRDHRERQGRYVNDDDDDANSEREAASGDKEDEGYADGSPTSPRSPHPRSPHREMMGKHAPKYQDQDHERWERQSEGNQRRSSRTQDDNRWPDRRDEYRHGDREEMQEDEQPADAEGRHRYGRHSVPPYVELRARNEPRGNPNRSREHRSMADVHAEPHYASVVRKPRPDRNAEPPAKDRRSDKMPERSRAERIQEEHPYASVERRDPPDRSMAKRSPEKIYESVDDERPRDRPYENRNRDDWYRDEKYREDRQWEDRYQEERPRERRYHDEDRPRDRRYGDDRFRNERYNDDHHHENRYRNGRHRDDRYHDRYHDDRYSNRLDGRKVDRREDRHEAETAKKHNDPDKVKNSDAKQKQREGETVSRKESDAAKGKETLKRKESDKASKDKKADKSKTKENDKKDGEKEESKLTRRKSDKDKKKEKEKEAKKKAKSKDKEEKASSEEEISEEKSAKQKRDHHRHDPRNDRHHDDRRGDTLDRRRRGERGTGDGKDHRRDDGLYDRRRDGRDHHRSPPPGDKYGYSSLGRPARRRSSNDPNQPYHRGPRESGYQSDHDRHRPDNHYDSNHHSAAPNHKGHTTSNHYPEERRPHMSSSHSTDYVHDDGYREDYGSLKHRSRSDRRMQDYDAFDAAQV